jgi:hypothetical protein
VLDGFTAKAWRSKAARKNLKAAKNFSEKQEVHNLL